MKNTQLKIKGPTMSDKLRSDFEDYYWEKYGHVVFVGSQNFKARFFAKQGQFYDAPQLNRGFDIYKAATERAARICDEKVEQLGLLSGSIAVCELAKEIRGK